jgi:alkanesulfonate monooxygenase SsuD/methylene tetrahydromethanopterin reductase-like flavin-dependent oxidoreductase (luciferase family)
MRLRFGLFGGAKAAGSGPDADSHGYRQFIEYVIAAETLGFESLFVVEHHFTGVGQVSASLNLLSFLAARTHRMRLGTAVVVLPWHNPLLLAEQASTLDLLSGGRLDLGIGKGYRASEFAGFCIPQAEADARFDEAVEVLRRAWTSPGRFSHHGPRWRFENVVVEPRPVQQPHPPLWMAAGSPASIRRAARDGFHLLLDQIAPTELTLERASLYRDAL